MALERWGSFSVRDHLDLQALTANVLLYDRLIIPVPAGGDEESRWAAMGWDPQSLYRRIDQLGDRVVSKPWDAHRQETYQNKLSELHALDHDVQNVTLPYQVSRLILAQEKIDLPPGVTHVEPVLAYNSESDLRRDFILDRLGDHRTAQMGLLFGQKLALPEGTDPEETLLRAIDLARDDEFRAKRRSLYEWQHQVLSRGYEPARAVEEMEELISAYNKRVQDASRTVYYKFAFLIATVGITVADTFAGSDFALASGLVAAVQFATLEREPVVEPGESRPAAAFHDMKNVVDWRA